MLEQTHPLSEISMVYENHINLSNRGYGGRKSQAVSPFAVCPMKMSIHRV